MCRFYLGDNYVPDDITGLGENVSGPLVVILDKLTWIINHSNGLPSVVDAYGDNVDWIRIQALNQVL